MARLPAGAELVLNKVSAAPGFWIGNVIVMAGVPQIMQVMLDYVTPKLRTGSKMLSQSVRADCREGDIGTELGEIAAAHAGVIIGSYPFMDEQRGANTHVVVRSRDPQKLAAAVAAVEAMLLRHEAVQEAAVVGLPDARWGEAPHAFVVFKAGQSASGDELHRRAGVHSSALRDAEVIARGSCYRPLTVDGIPLIGPVPDAPGAYLATAHASWGICNAPATGRMVAEMILDGGSRSVDAAPFALTRLPAGRIARRSEGPAAPA